MNRIFLIFCAVMCALAASWFWKITRPYWWRTTASGYEATDATVEKLQNPLINAVSYRFTVDDEEYTGWGYAPAGTEVSATIRVFYDPDYPRHTYSEYRSPLRVALDPIFIYVLFPFFSLATVACFGTALKP